MKSWSRSDEGLPGTGEILSKADDRLQRAEELLRPDERLKAAAVMLPRDCEILPYVLEEAPRGLVRG